MDYLEEIEQLLAKYPNDEPWKAVEMNESGHRASSWMRVYIRDYRYFDVDFSHDAKLIVALRNGASALVKRVRDLETQARKDQQEMARLRFLGGKGTRDGW
jgi:uncharacterized protein YcaQ